MYALVILLTGCGYPRPGPGRRHAPSGQPHCGRRRDGGAALHPVLVHLPRRPWSASGCVVSVCAHPAARASRRGAVGRARSRWRSAACSSCPGLPTFLYQAKHTGTPWAAPPNFSAVINALTGFTDNQGSTLQTGTNQGRLLAVIYFAMLALAVFGVGQSGRIIELDLRTRPRARSLGFVVLGHAVRRHRRRHRHRQRVLLALRRRRLPALPPPRRAGDDDAAQPEGPRRHRRAGRRGRADLVGPERDHPADPGQRRGGRHQRAGQARGRHRLLPRPAGPVRLPPDRQSVAVRHADLPAPHRARHRRLGRLRRRRPRGRPQCLRRRPSSQQGGRRRTTSGWSGSRCTRPSASSARRSPPTC